jgi:hypothetical protein
MFIDGYILFLEHIIPLRIYTDIDESYNEIYRLTITKRSEGLIGQYLDFIESIISSNIVIFTAFQNYDRITLKFCTTLNMYKLEVE